MLNYQICVYMPYLYTHNVVKLVAVFQNGRQNLTVHN